MINVGNNAGVQLQELPQGTHIRGLFQEIEKYPVRPKVHAFQKDEAICFTDKTGLNVCGDVQATIQVSANRAADIYNMWKLDFDDLVDTPIRNDLKSFLARESEKVPVSCAMAQPASGDGSKAITADTCTGQLIGEGRQAVLSKAALNWSTKWAKEGVSISDVQWIGGLRYPDAITNAITERTKIEQETLAAQQKAARAKAEADSKIETARGEAESVRLNAQAAKDSSALIDKIFAEKSKGFCPPGTKVCIVGAAANQLVNSDQ
jgi:regulator of protease activity HflC (stomatin/prohibitin superfamily)